MNELAVLTKAEQMLAGIKNASDAKRLIDMASTAEHYARKAKLSEEIMDHAHSIKTEAEALLGKYLAPKEPGRPPKEIVERSTIIPPLKELGITKQESSDAQFLCGLKEKDPDIFEQIRSNELTINEARRVLQRERAAAFVPTPLPTGKFDIIYADPPWRYEHSISSSRDIENQYPTMELAEICAIDVPAADDCILFLWATNPKLEEAMTVIKAWGFEYRTNMVWVKDKIGMGYYVRQQHELLLIAKRGNPPMALEENRPSSVLQAVRSSKHSKKPDEIYALIETMFPKRSYVELFARQERQSWMGWKNDSGL